MNGEILNQQVLAFDAPALRLQMRIDRRNARAQGFVARDKDDIRIVGREWLGVINRGERAAECIIFDQTGGDELIRSAENIG